MKPNCLDISLIDDNRAVAPLIGFILLFGFLTIAFVGYQAQVVPQQSAETEFEHFQENRNELIELRSAILTAGTSDRAQFPTVKLGTTYRTRVLALNGPDPAGLLQTSDPYPITISDESGNEPSVDTRFLEYRPGYNQLDVGSTWYENSVLYLDEIESGGNRVIIEDQSLVDKGTLQITALQNPFQRSGTGRITLELKTLNENNIGNLDELNEDDMLTVKLPTRLDDDYWQDQFNQTSAVTVTGFEPNEFDEGVNQIELEVDDVTVNTVGISEEPDEEPAKNIELQRAGNGNGNGNGGDPVFDSFTVSPSEMDNNEILEVTANGEISSPNENGEIQMETLQAGSGNTLNENEVHMESPFEITTDGGANNVRVSLRLLDNDTVVEECTTSEQMSDEDDQLTKDDFDCE